jgi:hypothetical protein
MKSKHFTPELDLFFRSSSPDEVCYLIHFLTPLLKKNGVKVQHYLGYSKHFAARYHAHVTGRNSAKLVEAVTRSTKCCAWLIAKTWQANRLFERYLKNKKMNFAAICPICNGENVKRRTADMPF